MPTNRDDYEAACLEWAHFILAQWIEMFDVFNGRRGWHFVPGNGTESPVWCFGDLGACRLAVSVIGETVLIYDHAADKEHHVFDVASAVAWLDRHEAEYEGLTPVQQELLDDRASPEKLERMLDDDGTNDDS